MSASSSTASASAAASTPEVVEIPAGVYNYANPGAMSPVSESLSLDDDRMILIEAPHLTDTRYEIPATYIPADSLWDALIKEEDVIVFPVAYPTSNSGDLATQPWMYDVVISHLRGLKGTTLPAIGEPGAPTAAPFYGTHVLMVPVIEDGVEHPRERRRRTVMSSNAANYLPPELLEPLRDLTNDQLLQLYQLGIYLGMTSLIDFALVVLGTRMYPMTEDERSALLARAEKILPDDRPEEERLATASSSSSA